jgi:hypothetical protein
MTIGAGDQGATPASGWADDAEFTGWAGWPAEAGENVPAAGTAAGPGQPGPGDAAQSQRAGARADQAAHPARLALGVALLAADRLRSGAPSDTFVVGVGLAQQTVAEMRGLARRALGPPSRAASRTLDWASKRTGVSANSGLAGRTRAHVSRLLVNARDAGRATIAAGREDAATFVRSSVADGMAWAETQAVPRIVDSLVPHLVDSVVPRLLDGVMPEIRATVLPAVVDDLTNDPRVRELVMEQSRGVIGEAAQHVRSATASADSRVENVFRRLIGAGPEPPSEGAPAAPHDG